MSCATSEGRRGDAMTPSPLSSRSLSVEMSAVGLDRDTFEKIRAIVYARSGIVLKDDKATLVAGRLGRRLRELGIATPRDYLAYLESDVSGAELTHLLDAMSTNVT